MITYQFEDEQPEVSYQFEDEGNGGATRTWEEEPSGRWAGIQQTMSAPSDEAWWESVYKVPYRVYNVAGDVAGFANDLVGKGVSAAYNKFVPESWQENLKGWGQELMYAPSEVSSNESFGESFDYVPGRAAKTLAEAYAELKRYSPELAKTLESTANIAGAYYGVKGLGELAPYAKRAVGEVSDVMGNISAYAARKTPEVIEKELAEVVEYGMNKGVRPTVAGKGDIVQIEKYYGNATQGVKDIIEYSDALPQSLEDFSRSISQTKKNIFSEYDSMAKQAGQAGAEVNISSIIDDMRTLGSNDVLRATNPGEANRLIAQADSWKELFPSGNISPQKAQDIIASINAETKSFWKNPNFGDPRKAASQERIAKLLRESTDEAITAYEGPGYQDLKKRWGSLNAIEDDVAHRMVVDGRKNIKGFFDLADIAGAAEFAIGLARLDPANIAAALAMKGAKNWIKHINDPNRIIKNMFQDAESILGTKTSIPKPPMGLGEYLTPGNERLPVTPFPGGPAGQGMQDMSFLGEYGLGEPRVGGEFTKIKPRVFKNIEPDIGEYGGQGTILDVPGGGVIPRKYKIKIPNLGEY